MKGKYFSILAVLVVILVGCGANQNTKETKKSEEPTIVEKVKDKVDEYIGKDAQEKIKENASTIIEKTKTKVKEVIGTNTKKYEGKSDNGVVTMTYDMNGDDISNTKVTTNPSKPNDAMAIEKVTTLIDQNDKFPTGVHDASTSATTSTSDFEEAFNNAKMVSSN